MKEQQRKRSGKDEMNLAEFPIARLGRRDTRKSITYEGQVVDKQGNIQRQKWIVSGVEPVGLPTEFAERVLVALIAIAAAEKFVTRRVEFSIYQLVQRMGLAVSNRNYDAVKLALKQLAGVTIFSEGAFYDTKASKRITTERAFHLLDEIWLKSWGEDEEEECQGYAIWSTRLFESFRAGYIKHLDTAFYYSLQNAVARRLYRFLDKRMRYQHRYEIDIFDLGGRIGLRHYKYPSKVLEKLQPGLDELQERGFLDTAKVVKVGKFTRLRFLRPKNGPEKRTEGQEQPELSSFVAEPPEPLFTASVAPEIPFEEKTDTEILWDMVQQDLAQLLHPAALAMLDGCHLVTVEAGTAHLTVPDEQRDWVERQLGRKLLQAMQQSDPSIERVAWEAA